MIHPGEGLHIARPGWPAEFLVNAQTAGVGHLTANIQGNILNFLSTEMQIVFTLKSR